MKWIKRIFYTTLVLVLVGAGAVVVLDQLRRRKPEWYPSAAPTPEAIAAAANRVTQKMAGVQGWIASSHAQRQRHANRTTGPIGDTDADPEPAKTIELTEEELNAFFSAWDRNQGWSGKYEQHVVDPVLVLRDDRIILAGTVKEADTVVSVHLEPRLDEQGMLRLRLVRVMGGRLPLPEVLWSRYRKTVTDMMVRKLDQLRPGAQIRDDGAANPAAVGAAMNRLLLHAINDEPAEPVLFLPHDLHRVENGFPVKLTDLKVVDRAITMTVVPMDEPEREALLARIKAPYGPPKPAVTAAAR